MTVQIIASDNRIQEKARRAINTLKTVMVQFKVTLLAVSYGKESSTILGLALQAARELKAEQDHLANIVILTSDTGVENPSVIKLAHKMSAQALALAKEEGLSIRQKWVQPTPADHYIVQMVGGRSIASMPGQQGSCAVDLKIRPMQMVQKELAKEFGAQNIVTAIGTRFDESATRRAQMTARGESDTSVQRTDTGSGLLSPIATWSEGDVWSFLNGTERQLGFETLNWAPTLAMYESAGEATCSLGAIDAAFSKSAGSCGSTRMGCWSCQKITKDQSLIGMTRTNPAYEPLTRLSRTIRAGHFVAENRSYLGRSIDTDGTIKVFANTYSPLWTTKLLQWTLTIDAREDDRARTTGKPRRFPRVLEVEHLLMIAFFWARYGQQKPGAFIRIYDDIVAGGARYDLPTDAEIDALEASGNRSITGKTYGYLTTNQSVTTQFSDGWRSVLADFSSFDADAPACGVSAMMQPDYRSGKGLSHDPIVNEDQLSVNVGALEFTEQDGTPSLMFHDFMWWYLLEFGDQQKSHADELQWLFRNGIIRGRRGYQTQLNRYLDYGNALSEAGLSGHSGSLDAITSHPNFVTEKPESRTVESAPTVLPPAHTLPTVAHMPEQLSLIA